MPFRPKPGDIIATNKSGGVVARCAGADSDGLRWTSTDGYTEFQPTSIWRSLDAILDGWRPATDAEAASFSRLYSDRTTPNYY
jgi:hypothetical protein